METYSSKGPLRYTISIPRKRMTNENGLEKGILQNLDQTLDSSMLLFLFFSLAQ